MEHTSLLLLVDGYWLVVKWRDEKISAINRLLPTIDSARTLPNPPIKSQYKYYINLHKSGMS